jgi:hypothetical protein
MNILNILIMRKKIRLMQSHINYYVKSAMESGDHFKNGASPKSQTSRRNRLMSK